jgi:Flp pilus assembly protein TadB
MTGLVPVVLAAAVAVWPPARPARARLSSVTGVAAHGPRRARRWWRPAVFAGSVGMLVSLSIGWPLGAVAAVAAWLGLRRYLRRGPCAQPPDPLAVAATWDLLAACLRAGLPVPTAVRVVAGDLPAEAADALRATADLLALGADPVEAWSPALDCPVTAGLARGARRSTRSGTALAGIATTLAEGIRDTAGDVAEARAQRAGVLIAGPLGLCFLPAFVCLGIVPVVVGLATQLSVHP